MSRTRLRAHLRAPRERVYAAWMVPDGMTSTVHAFDARVGGTFRVTLAYGTPTGSGKTTLTVELRDVDGGTDLVAIHDRLPPGLSPADNETGWRMSLAKLAALVGAPAPPFASRPRVERLVPRRVVGDADRAIAFYRAAFGAAEVACHRGPDGRVLHAELAVHGAHFHVKDADGFDRDPRTVGGTPLVLHVYTDDVDAMAEAAVRAGAEIVYPVADQEYGERAGRIRDPSGHLWILSTQLGAP